MDKDPKVQLVLLQQQVANHIEEFHEHRAEYKAYREEESERWDHLLKSQEANAVAINRLAESSSDLLSAWEAATGTVKVLSAIGKFIKWLSGFAIIGAFITWIVQHFGTK